MEYRQNMNYLSLEKDINQNFGFHFSIQGDLGTVFIPGQMVSSDSYRIIYCQSNCGAEFVADGEHYHLQRGDMVLLKAKVRHGFVSYGKGDELYSGYVVNLSREYMKYLMLHVDFTGTDFKNGSKLVQTRGTLWERIDAMFLMTLEEAEIKTLGWQMALFGSSIMLLIQIARAACMDPSAPTKVEKQELLTGILAYVEANLQEKITLEDVANRFFVSASTVTHLFSKRMNISFYKYVMQRRLWQAKNLIREGMAMEKISTQVGFNDYSAFYRAFKQEFGMSPRQFAKENR